jgi:hypothetical protein
MRCATGWSFFPTGNEESAQAVRIKTPRELVDSRGVGGIEAASLPLSMERIVPRRVPLAEEAGRKAARYSAVANCGTFFPAAASE